MIPCSNISRRFHQMAQDVVEETIERTELDKKLTLTKLNHSPNR